MRDRVSRLSKCSGLLNGVTYIASMRKCVSAVTLGVFCVCSYALALLFVPWALLYSQQMTACGKMHSHAFFYVSAEERRQKRRYKIQAQRTMKNSRRWYAKWRRLGGVRNVYITCGLESLCYFIRIWVFLSILHLALCFTAW